MEQNTDSMPRRSLLDTQRGSNHHKTSTGLQSILKRRLKYLNMHYHSDGSGWRYYYTSNWRVCCLKSFSCMKRVKYCNFLFKELSSKALMEDFQILHHFIWTRFCRHDYPLPAKKRMYKSLFASASTIIKNKFYILCALTK